jgi:thiamine pyrophosphokinase
MTERDGAARESRGRVLLLANGRPPGRKFWKRLRSCCDALVCVDGGADTARDLGAVPDVVVGDFDSVSREARSAFAGVDWVQLDDQESSDLDKGLACVADRGWRDVSVAGALGREPDHALANIGLLLKYRRTLSVTLHDRRQDLFAVEGLWEWQPDGERRISLLPVFGPCTVTSEGLLYPLRGLRLEMGVKDGLSNRACGVAVRLECEGAPLLVCVERGGGGEPVFAPPLPS